MPVVAMMWDLDGTLIDTERESAEAMARALSRGIGIEIEQEDRDFIIGRSWVEIHRQLRSRYAALTWTMEELIARTASARRSLFEEIGLEPLPGVRDAITRFDSLPKAIVTGSSRQEASDALDLTGLRKHFSAVFAAEDVPSSKPDPAGYLLAARHLKVEPARCVVIEDSAPGISAGRAAGAFVVAVRQGNFADHDQGRAHCVIDSLDELSASLWRDW